MTLYVLRYSINGGLTWLDSEPMLHSRLRRAQRHLKALYPFALTIPATRH